MKNQRLFIVGRSVLKSLTFSVLISTAVSSCKDDPQPTNEEEVITTFIVDLSPVGGGEPLELKFYDEDGDGSIGPVITPELLELEAGKNYLAEITLLNETLSPVEDITEEIEEEKNDHIFCFALTGVDIAVIYEDEDDNGYAIGLRTTWEAGSAGEAGEIEITLRHQPGVKNGDCPGNGDSDIQIIFPVKVIQ